MDLTILKRDAQTGDVIPNTHFEIKGIHYGYHNDVSQWLPAETPYRGWDCLYPFQFW